jgi:hypothetical protein
MCIAVEHLVATLHGQVRERLGNVTLAEAGRPYTESAFTLINELQRRQF